MLHATSAEAASTPDKSVTSTEPAPAERQTHDEESTREDTVEAELVEGELWRQFHRYQNEMIITKAGRCLFPLYRIAFRQSAAGPPGEGSTVTLATDRHYRVAVDIQPVDENKWKYRHDKWTPLLTSRALGQPAAPARSVLFNARQLGGDILLNGLNFDKLKLTNRETGNTLALCLQSFHRYIPVTTLTECEDPNRVQRIIFPETGFIAVTHYQNEHVTLLKKSYNPHAKGFVISDEPPVRGTVSWMLSPEASSPVALGKRRRVRKRIRPVNLANDEETVGESIPSDEEELQGGIALQLLGRPQST